MDRPPHYRGYRRLVHSFQQVMIDCSILESTMNEHRRLMDACSDYLDDRRLKKRPILSVWILAKLLQKERDRSFVTASYWYIGI
jgi:hypothetical protein